MQPSQMPWQTPDPWLRRIGAPLLTSVWFESGLAYAHLPAVLSLTLAGISLGSYPKTAAVLLLPLLTTFFTLLFDYLPGAAYPLTFPTLIRRLSSLLATVFMVIALVVDSSSDIRQMVGQKPFHFDLKLMAIGLALAGAWLAVRALYWPEARLRPPANIAIAGGLSGMVIIITFLGSAVVAVAASGIAFTTVLSAVLLDRRNQDP